MATATTTTNRGEFVRRVTAKLGLPADASGETILAKVSEVKANARGAVAPGAEYPASSYPDVMSEAEYDALTAPAKLQALSAEDEAVYRALFGSDA